MPHEHEDMAEDHEARARIGAMEKVVEMHMKQCESDREDEREFRREIKGLIESLHLRMGTTKREFQNRIIGGLAAAFFLALTAVGVLLKPKLGL